MADMKWVPLSTARPSLAWNVTGAIPASRSASPPGSTRPLYRASPSPMSTSARWADGARSPLAPTDPFSGITGRMSRASMLSRVSTTTGRTPENPLAITLARISIAARVSSGLSDRPVPAAWDRIRLACSASSWSTLIRTWLSLPKPVVIP